MLSSPVAFVFLSESIILTISFSSEGARKMLDSEDLIQSSVLSYVSFVLSELMKKLLNASAIFKGSSIVVWSILIFEILFLDVELLSLLFIIDHDALHLFFELSM